MRSFRRAFKEVAAEITSIDFYRDRNDVPPDKPRFIIAAALVIERGEKRRAKILSIRENTLRTARCVYWVSSKDHNASDRRSFVLPVDRSVCRERAKYLPNKANPRRAPATFLSLV